VIYTNSFSEEKAVARLSELIALACGAPPAEAKQIGVASALHDIGKQKIDPAILNKPGKFTAREFEIMKTHTVLGAEMLRSFQGALGEKARLIAQYHHERWDGRGYWGKQAGELPFFLLAMFERDGQPAEKIIRNYIRAKLWPGVRPYKTENLYKYLEEEGKSIAGQEKTTAAAPVKRHTPVRGKQAGRRRG
jgi:putative nucleotidyltransferase with HDIG domain